MPCTCEGYPDEPDEHVGVAADALCQIMQEHEARGDMSCFSKSALAWWEEHKKRDKRRLQEDMRAARDSKAKAKALAKLSAYERSLLGY